MLGEERRSWRLRLLPFLQFSLGRLLAYAGIGALAGWAGRSAAALLARIKAPFWLGLLLGFNICPPFVTAMADVFLHSRIAYGPVFFLVFFLVTTLFLLPLVFLSYLARFENLRCIGRWAALIGGAFYLLAGCSISFPEQSGPIEIRPLSLYNFPAPRATARQRRRS